MNKTSDPKEQEAKDRDNIVWNELLSLASNIAKFHVNGRKPNNGYKYYRNITKRLQFYYKYGIIKMYKSVI